MVYLFGRLWGSPPAFSRDSLFDDFPPSFLEADIAAEVEWSVSISLVSYCTMLLVMLSLLRENGFMATAAYITVPANSLTFVHK